MDFPKHVKLAALANRRSDAINAIDNGKGEIIYCLEASLIRLFARALKYSYTIENPKDTQIGQRLSSTNWTGLIGLLYREEADFSINMLGPTEERAEVVDFSYPYYITDVTFLTNKPEEMAKSFAIFYPFSYEIWLTLAIVYFVMSLVFFVISNKQKSYQLILISMFGSLLTQSLNFEFKTLHKRLVLIFWSTGVMCLTYSYQATLLTFLTFPPLKGVHNMAELAKAVEEGTHICRTYKGSYIINTFLESEEQSLRIIGQSLKEHSGTLNDPKGFLDNLKIKKGAFITGRVFLRSLKEKYFLSQDRTFVMMFAIGMRKSFCCKKSLDKIIRRISEGGLYEKIWQDKDLFTRIKHLNEFISEEKEHQLSLGDTTAAFIIFIAGNIFASLVLLMEIILKRMFKDN